MNVIFMGAPEFAVPSLQALIDSKHNVIAVYTQPPRPAGRGQKVRKTPVHTLADAHNIPVYTPKNFKNAEDVAQLAALKPDVICVTAYGLLLPQSVLDVATCVNVHPSALPRWRGAAPMNYPLLAGDTKTEICIMQMEKGLDSGPVYWREPYAIGNNETAGDLMTRLAPEGGRLLVEVLDNFDVMQPVPQTEDGMTYAHKFKSEELDALRVMDFIKTAQQLHNQVRGLSPWPGCVVHINNEEIKVLRSHIVENVNKAAGSIAFADHENGIVIACGDGNGLRLSQAQRAGKKAMSDVDLLNGFNIQVGANVT